MYNRHSIRLKDYDYSKEGMYFITICIKNRMNILSNVSNSYLNNENCRGVVGKEYLKEFTELRPISDNCKDILELSTFGRIIENELLHLNKIYKNISIISYIIMPDHIHFILQINEKTDCILGNVIKTFKSITNKKINKIQKIDLWQRNYFEHIIRNEKELLSIIQYIENNPYKLIEHK